MSRALMIAVAIVLGPVAAQANCIGEEAPRGMTDAVCCSVDYQSRWLTRAQCDRILNQAQSCFSGRGKFDMDTGRCSIAPNADVRPPPKSQEEQMRDDMERARLVNMCASKVSILIEAASLRGSGWSQARTTEYLVSRYAYGPGGQVYRDSSDAEVAIRAWVRDTYGKYRTVTDFQSIFPECMAGR